MDSWTDYFVSAKLSEFWKSEGLAGWHNAASLPRSKRPLRVLIAGNGLSRLANANSENTASWNEWIAGTWNERLLGVKHEVALDKGLSEPERLSFMLSTYRESKDPAAAKAGEELFERLKQLTEKELAPHPIHDLCCTAFDVLITTNYDTLFERAFRQSNLGARVVIVEAREDLDEGYRIVTEDLSSGNRRRTRPTKLIIKFHGSFALTCSGYKEDRDTLAVGFGSYRVRSIAMPRIVNDLIGLIDNIGRPRWRLWRNRNERRPVDIVLLGHGLSFSDMGLSHLLSRLEPRSSIMLDFGGDVLDEHRAVGDWGLSHRLNIPLDIGGGTEFRKRTTLAFLKSLQELPTPSSSPPSRTPYALMIGQASYGYVFRTDRPIAEHSHAIYGSFYMEIDEGTRKRAYELIRAAHSIAADDRQQQLAREWMREWHGHRYNVAQVQGQILTPALLMDRWSVPTTFASIIGADVLGRRIKQLLQERPHLDTSFVFPSQAIDRTDHSYVAAFGGMRTLFDHSESGDHNDSPDFAGKVQELFSELMLRIGYAQSEPNSASVADPSKRPAPLPRGVPSVLYLSKWLLRQSAPLVARLANDRNRPLILYETGSVGTRTLEVERQVLGDTCDIVLASPIVPMRIARAPLAPAQIGDADRHVDAIAWPKLSAQSETFSDPEPPQTLTVARWHSMFAGHQQNANQILAFHHVMFPVAIVCLGPAYLARCLYDGFPGFIPEPPFFRVAMHWVVTAGEFGMFLISRPPGASTNWKGTARIFWVSPPDYDTSNHYIPGHKVLNTLGCGDIARGAFIGRFMKDPRIQGNRDTLLSDHEAVLDCVRSAVAAGKERTRIFGLTEAIAARDMDYERIVAAGAACNVTEISESNLDHFAHVARAIYLNFMTWQSPMGQRARDAVINRAPVTTDFSSMEFGDIENELNEIRRRLGPNDVTRTLPSELLDAYEDSHFGHIPGKLLGAWKRVRGVYSGL